ncbi:MAG TPA: TolC family protein [Prolixibacteraceae bacterium]|nr:TolC family protein [Prolixibacteraceae bacterium]HPR86027.1 TolC family protein [Prolixibacteraceae bacterium]
MKRIYSLLAVLLVLVFVTGARAQEKWSLQRCIDYALKNNIDIKQRTLNSKYYNNQLSQAKSNLLPNLNASAQNSMSFGRSLGADNTYLNVNSNSTSGSLSANMTLWNGSTLRNAIKVADMDLRSTLEDLQKAKDDMMLNIAAAYLEILFADELENVAEELLKITQQQIDRTTKLVEAGSLAKGSLLEIDAQFAREELDVVNAKNRLQLAYLSLYQLLDLPATESFLIEKPVLPEIGANMSLMNTMDVFKNAVEIRPAVKSAEYKLESARSQLLIAKGNRLPSLTFNGNYYNYYNNKYTNYTGGKISLDEQLKTNQRYGFGFTLSVPIFNRFQVKNGIANSQIQLENNELQVQSTKNALRKEIEQAYTNALAAFKRYVANQKAVVSSQEAFRYAEEKFNVGMMNSVEYNQSKNNLSSAQSNLLQAKYEYIFRTKILDFYNGRAIEL